MSDYALTPRPGQQGGLRPSATVIADSISPKGDRVTTMEVTMHRFVLAEFNTHRVFSRNSASSRAIPVIKQLDRLRKTPAWPLEWPSEQSGMQGGQPLDEDHERDARRLFYDAFMAVNELIDDYLEDHPDDDERLHKSLLNRLIEPFMVHKVVVTSTEWDNFFKQRCSPLAQPEIRVAAEAMESALRDSKPESVRSGGWHLPYINEEERVDLALADQIKVSAARCARVSYLTHDGVRDVAKDLGLYERLTTADPMHASPLEHPCTPLIDGMRPSGNFKGWRQARFIVQSTCDPIEAHLANWRA